MARQFFDTADVIRLEVTRDPVGAEQRNLITNPDASGGDGNIERRGGWGWSTPISASEMRWAWTAGTGSPTYLQYGDDSNTAQAETYFQSQRAVIVGKSHVAASWNHLTTKDYTIDSGVSDGPFYSCAEFRFLDASGAYMESSAPSAWGNGVIGAGPLAAVPAGAYYAQLRIYVALDMHGAPFPAASNLRYALTDVTMLVYDSAPALAVTTRTNLLTNPSFNAGVTSWSPSGAISQVTSPVYEGAGALRLAITSNPHDVFASAPATTAGLSYTFSIRVRGGSVPTRARAYMEFLDASNVIVGVRELGSFVTTDTTFQLIRITRTAPAGSTKVRCGMQTYDATSGTIYYDAALLEQTDRANRWFSGSRSTLSAALPATPNQYWTEITNDAVTIGTNRVMGDVGTLNADLQSAALDPATNSLLSKGRGVRLSARGTGAWKPLFRGRLNDPRAAYELLNPVGDRNLITLDAADAIATMAGNRTTGGHGDLYVTANKMETLALPFNFLDSRNVNAVNSNSYTADVSYLDALLIARDSNICDPFGTTPQPVYAWVNAHGVVTVQQAQWLPAAIPLTDADFNGDLRISYDPSTIINSVTIVELSGSGQTEYGPYEDGASIARYGRCSATFTVAPSASYYNRTTLANTILARNATPAIAVESAVIPLHTLARIDQWAALDLGQRLTLSVAELGYSEVLVADSIAHSITRDKWLMALTFTDPDRIPIPTTGA